MYVKKIEHKTGSYQRVRVQCDTSLQESKTLITLYKHRETKPGPRTRTTQFVPSFDPSSDFMNNEMIPGQDSTVCSFLKQEALRLVIGDSLDSLYSIEFSR